MVYYFAYGSNMDENRFKSRIKNYKIIGKGLLKDYQLRFNKPAMKDDWGYANVCPKKGCQVEGVIYEVDEESLKELDKYERVPDQYYRYKLNINAKNKKLKCDVYIASGIDDSLKPVRWYLQFLLNGKKYLTKKYLESLKKTETFD